MIFLILMLSCTFKGLRVKEKGKREDISKAISEAIQNPDNENSKDILEKVNKFTAFYRNENGLLPIEEAIEFENMEAVQLLVKICEYPDKIYERIVNKKNIDLFRLIPQEKLDYMLLSRIKENEDKELEEEFLKRIEVTGLERLIVSGKIEEIKSKSKEWVIENYRDYRGTINQRRIDTAEILCIYCETDFIKEIIKILEEDIKDVKEELFFAVSKLGEKGKVECLLDLGIDVNHKSGNGSTALMVAARRGHKEVCELLIKKGARVNTISRDEEKTVLMAAAENGHKEVCELLIEEGARVKPMRRYERTALMYAAENGHKEVCQLLIKKGADVKIVSKTRMTVLMFAASWGHKEVCQLLIDKGADVNAADTWGSIVLMRAARRGPKELCELLIEKGADVNAVDKCGMTTLMIAAKRGLTEVCQLLIKKGADVNAIRRDGQTSLMCAVWEGDKEVCEFLIDKGADVNAVDKYERQTSLMCAANRGYKEVCELLVGKGADVNAVRKDGRTALMIAAKNGHKEVCELLIEKGADVNLSDNNGNTALTLSNENDIVALLIRSTVDSIIRNGAPIYEYSSEQLDKLKELIGEIELDTNSLTINQKPLLVLALEKENISYVNRQKYE